MSDRSGQNDAYNSFAGISFDGVNAVPPQSGENGDTINLADVADVSEQDDVSNAATETMPPLNFASDQTQPFQSFPTAGAAETTPAGTVPNGAVPTGAIPTGDMPSSTPAPAIPVLTMPVEGEAVVPTKRTPSNQRKWRENCRPTHRDSRCISAPRQASRQRFHRPDILLAPRSHRVSR